MSVSRNLILISVLLLPAWGHAGVDEGVAAYNRGDHVVAYQEFLPVAEAGDKKAQLLLGLMYDNGLGIDQDHAQAAKWYGRAAEQGHARAQFNLGLMLETGEGVSQDKKLALDWIKKSAEQGFAEAQDKLGQFYEAGQYVEQDLVRSHLWFSLAVAQGARESLAGRDRVEAQLTPSDIEESQKMFDVWQNVYQSVF